MPEPDGSPSDRQVGDAASQGQAGARPTGPAGPLATVPFWRKVLWVLAVLYALFLIITGLLD